MTKLTALERKLRDNEEQRRKRAKILALFNPSGERFGDADECEETNINPDGPTAA